MHIAEYSRESAKPNGHRDAIPACAGIVGVLAAAFSLSACAVSDDPAVTVPGKDICGAAEYRQRIGENIAAVSIPDDLYHRVIGPNTIVTKDYRPERLNIYVDDNGTIERVVCG